MNTFFKSVILSIVLITFPISAVITINGKDINEFLKPGQTLTYEDTSRDNICFIFKDGNVEIGSITLKNQKAVSEYFQELENAKDQLHNMNSKEVNIQSGSTIKLDGAYWIGEEEIFMEAETNVNISSAILKSPKIFIIGKDEMKLQACFIDGDFLHIESTSPKSLIKAIRFTFDKKLSSPACVQGEINFAFNETTGDFIVMGAHKVEILFSPEAFA